MKLQASFVTYDSDGEQLMVSCDHKLFSGYVRSNRTAAFLVDRLKQETTRDDLVDALFEAYDAPREVLERDVDRFLEQLRSIHALDES